MITGVGDGIGRACATALALDGATVVVAARDADRLERIAAEVRSLGNNVLAMPTDISDVDQVHRLFEATASRFGRLDAVVNVAAWAGSPKPVEHFDADTFRRAFDINVVATLGVCKAALPHLRATGGGAIVQTSTLSAYTRLPSLADYTSTKAAMVTASLTLAREAGRDGIRVNIVVPGYTSGDGLDAYIQSHADRRGVAAEEIRRDLVASSALRMIPDPADIAEAVLYLASGRSRAVTGQQLHVNAGEWLP